MQDRVVRTTFVCLLLIGSAWGRSPAWKLQYFYDKIDSTLNLSDIQCPSARTCIAAGYIEDFHNEHHKGAVVVTSDGGEHWSLMEVTEQPFSLFFLNDSLGWMVTNKGVWRTTESGRAWKRLKAIIGVERVWFTDQTHGWAVGHPKAIYQTEDGGKQWTRVAATGLLKTPNDEDTVFSTIYFSGANGVIGGDFSNSPVRALPPWMDPANDKMRVPARSAFVLLKTENGGKNWEFRGASTKGFLLRLLIRKPGEAVGLFEFPASASPSSLLQIDLKTNKTVNLYDSEGIAIRDFTVLPDGTGVAAAIELPGKSSQLPIPGKLKMMTSMNFKTWLDMSVDYRAVAVHPVLAAADAEHVWVATDTGMILKLVAP